MYLGMLMQGRVPLFEREAQLKASKNNLCNRKTARQINRGKPFLPLFGCFA
jgi:hypothetical protein